MVRIGATMVIKCITWPHDVQYTLARKPAAYEGLIVSCFMQVYFITMKSHDAISENMMLHLEEPMGDVDLYGQEHVHAWLNKLEQSRFTWDDADAKLRFHRALV